MPLTRSEV